MGVFKTPHVGGPESGVDYCFVGHLRNCEEWLKLKYKLKFIVGLMIIFEHWLYTDELYFYRNIARHNKLLLIIFVGVCLCER